MKSGKKEISGTSSIRSVPMGPLIVGDLFGIINWVKKYVDSKLSAMEIKVGGFYASTTNYTPQQLHDTLGYGEWENICDSNSYNYLYLKAVKSTATTGEITYQKLPNIKGGIGIVGAGQAHAWMGTSGAFTAINQTGDTNGIAKVTITAQTTQTGTNFNAHNSNEIYQDGADVHPTNYSFYLYRRKA